MNFGPLYISLKKKKNLSTDFLDLNIGEGNCTPLQYSCLENLMERGVW